MGGMFFQEEERNTLLFTGGLQVKDMIYIYPPKEKNNR